MLGTAQNEQQHYGGLEPAGAELSHFSVCYTPRPGSALAQFGRSWFGRANDGTTLETFSATGLRDGGASEVTPTPGRYFGLHAPFLAPSRLRDDVRVEDVRSRLQSFAANRKPIETGPLKLTRMNRSLVFKPAEPRPELDWLALQCLHAFDSFAATATHAEGAFPHLSPYQRLLLKSFGQQNVMSEYRFSLRLTGPLDEAQIERVSHALRPLVGRLCDEGIQVDGLSLVGTAEGNSGSPVRLLGRYALAG